MRPIRSTRRGVALIVAVAVVGVLILYAGALAGIVGRERRGLEADQRRLQATWLVQAGAERAAIRLRQDPDYRGETWRLDAGRLGRPDRAEVVIAVETVPNDPGSRRARVVATLAADTARRTRMSGEFELDLTSRLTRNQGDQP
jgi:hypothetical protein